MSVKKHDMLHIILENMKHLNSDSVEPRREKTHLRNSRSASPSKFSALFSIGSRKPFFENSSRPRKKYSFKDPELMSSTNLAGRSCTQKKPPLQQLRSSSQPADFKLEESPYEEVNAEIDELESQAMRVVRTVGQAFEVCHKLSINSGPEDKDRHDKDRDTENHRRDDDYDDQSEIASVQPQPSPSSLHKDISLLGDEDDLIPEQTSVPLLLRSHDAAASTTPIRQSPMESITPDSGNLLAGGELTALKHEIQLLRERLDQQNQQTRAAVAHARLLQDQLAAETAARVEAQARTHQLLVQNKELLEHIAALVSHLREHERITGVPLTGQSQVTNAAAISQTSAVADLSSLGQPVSQDNSWEPEASIFPYSSSDLLYLMNCSPLRLSEGNNYTDELYMQKQFLEKLGNHSSYQLPSYLPSSAYTMGARIIFPPSQSMNSSLRSQRYKIPFLPSDLTENNSNLDRTTCSKCNCTKIGNSYTNRLQFQGRSMDDTKPSTLESPSRRINGIENLNSNKETKKLDILLDSLNIIDELQNREKFQVQSKTQIRRNSK